MTRITALVNQKGGVGKTTAAMNLGAVTHEALGGHPDHSPVLVVDADTQESAGWWAERVAGLPFEYAPVKNPAEFTTLAALSQFRQIIVDTPGSLEDGRILSAVLNVVDDVLVPLPPEPLAFDPTARVVEQVLIPRGIPYHVFVSAWDPREGRRNLDTGEWEYPDLIETQEFIQARGWRMASSSLRRYKVVKRASSEKKVITQYPDNDRAATQAKNDFLRLALELGLGHPLHTPAARAVSIEGVG